MAISTAQILEIIGSYGIVPEESLEALELPATSGRDFPETGEIEGGETVYSTSLSEVFREEEGGAPGVFGRDDPRMQEWQNEINDIVRSVRENENSAIRARRPLDFLPAPSMIVVFSFSMRTRLALPSI